MKSQWMLVIGLLFTIVIAIFAIVNVDSVQVNFLFGSAQWPLILVILFSALLGALISGSIAIFRFYQSNRMIQELKKELQSKDQQLEALKVQHKEEVIPLQEDMSLDEQS